MIAVDTGACQLYEIFNASSKNNKRYGSSIAQFDMTKIQNRPVGWTSADAAGLPIFPLLVRYEEVAQGVIPHALRCTFAKTQKKYIRPATHYASSSTDPLDPPMGMRFRLKSDYDTSALQ